MVLDKQGQLPSRPPAEMDQVDNGSGQICRNKLTLNGTLLSSSSPGNGKEIPSVLSEGSEGQVDDWSLNSTDKVTNLSTFSLEDETKNGFHPREDQEFLQTLNGAGRPKEKDVSIRSQRKELEEEDKYCRLLEQIRQADEHIPLHKSVCCALCRTKELRLRKTMQDKRSFSCPDSAEDSTSVQLFPEETIFTRMLRADTAPPPPRPPPSSSSSSTSFGFRSQDTEANLFPDSEADDSSSCYSPECQNLNTDDLFSNVVKGQRSNGDSPNTQSTCQQCSKKQTTDQNGDSAVGSVDSSLDRTVDSSLNEKNEVNGLMERSASFWKNSLHNGSGKDTNFKRSASMRGSNQTTSNTKTTEGKAFTPRRFESFRVQKDPAADLQPIADPTLLQKLQTAAGIQPSQLRLSAKDQKMLAVLLAKKEQERQMRLRRESSYLLREEEQKDRERKALRRQLSLNETQLNYHKNHGHIVSRQNSVEHSFHEDHGEEHRCCSRYSSSLTSPPDKNQHSKKQLQQALERKKQVEQHLKERQEKTEKYLAQLKEKKEQEQQRAMITRQEKTKQLAEKSRQHNLHAHQKLKEARDSKKMTMEEILAMHEEKQAHLTAAEMKVKHLREQEKAKLENEIRRKLERSQQKQQKLEEELKQWKNELLEYRQLQESQAQSLAMATLAKKRETVAKERQAKERQQKENLTRMLAKENEWRAELEAAIQSKDARSRMIQEEKQRMIEKSRDAALTSRRIREELGLSLSMTDLDMILRHD